VRVNAFEIARYVKMQQAGLYALGPSFAQTCEMAVGISKYKRSELRLFSDQCASDSRVLVDKDTKRKFQVVDDPLVERFKLGSTLRGKDILVLNLLLASSSRFLSMMSPMCSRSIAKEIISVARRPSRSSRLPRVILVT
jgi:hypothetical protein